MTRDCSGQWTSLGVGVNSEIRKEEFLSLQMPDREGREDSSPRNHHLMRATSLRPQKCCMTHNLKPRCCCGFSSPETGSLLCPQQLRAGRAAVPIWTGSRTAGIASRWPTSMASLTPAAGSPAPRASHSPPGVGRPLWSLPFLGNGRGKDPVSPITQGLD